MSFESLPNEIFLDLFDYFDGTDLFHGFYGLNSRFNYLLYKQYRRFSFDFKSSSKSQFDIICQQHLPNIVDRVVTLDLSNDVHTPKQVDLFISYIPSIGQFTHLQSLSLSHFHIHTTIMKIIDQCHQLPGLTHLKFHSCYFINYPSHLQSIIDNIWSLPKLIHYDMSIFTLGQPNFYIPTKMSTSIKRLSLIKCRLALNEITPLFEYTPHLKHLSIYVRHLANDYLPTLLPTLISLKIRIFSINGISKIVLFLQNIPNLRRLDLEILSNIIDGYQLEHIITNYLPKLRELQLKMINTVDLKQNIQLQMNKLIDSFRSSFWINEHRWFVRCFLARESTIHLCTLSSILPRIDGNLPNLFMSTYPDDDLQQFCNDITEISNERFFDIPVPSNIRLSSIKRLEIQFPINEQFWTVVSTLKQLHTLKIDWNVDVSQSQLQTLLDRASHLSELTIRNDGSAPLQMSSFKYTNASVRQLDIHSGSYYFNEEESMVLSRTPLGAQCKVLSIQVRNRESILILVNNISNLRLLTISCEELVYSNHLVTEIDGLSHKDHVLHEYELIQWLKERLPSTYMINKHLHFPERIQIWM